MHATIWALFASSFVAEDPDISATQFAKILNAAHAQIRDVSFTYKGERKFNGPVNELSNVESTFQGNYAFRSDGAEFADVNVIRLNPKAPITRWSGALLKGNLEEMYWEPGAPLPIQKAPGDHSSFCRTEGPRDFFYVPFFAAMTDPAAYGYVFRGWESIGDRRCLVVELNPVPFPQTDPTRRLWNRFWIDIERGAHPIKVESYQGTTRVGLIDQIRLVEVRLPGGNGGVWIPVSSESKGFRWNKREHSDPVIKVTQNVVAGSVAVNRGLPDRFFSLTVKDGKAGSPELKALRGR